MRRRAILTLSGATVAIVMAAHPAQAVICQSPSFCMPWCPSGLIQACNNLIPPYCETTEATCDWWFNGCGFGDNPYRLSCTVKNR
jgi:hypothetical protein